MVVSKIVNQILEAEKILTMKKCLVKMSKQMPIYQAPF